MAEISAALSAGGGSLCLAYFLPPGCMIDTKFIPVANPGTASQLVPNSNPVISLFNHVAFGVVLGPLSNAPDQLVVGAAVVCFGTTATCVALSSPVVVSNGANGSPPGGMNPAIDSAGLLVSFSGTPTNSSLGMTQEIFLAAPFL